VSAGITVADKDQHGPKLKHNERVLYFEGPSGNRGEMSIREIDGELRIQLFNLGNAVVVCPEANYQSTAAKREAAKSN